MGAQAEDGIRIAQKRHSTRITFLFDDDELAYTIEDGSGRHTFRVPYASIPTDVDELIERNAWFRNAGIFWMCLGLLQIGMRWQQDRELHGSLWLTLGVVCVVVYAFRRTSYSIISTERGRVFIIRDQSHDRVMNEIDTRRKQHLRERYATVDLGNERDRELQKFDWLKEAGAISEAEHAAAVAAITEHHRGPERAPLANQRLH